jgi:Reverse transcriptase-like
MYSTYPNSVEEFSIFTDGSTFKTNPSIVGSCAFTLWADSNLIYAESRKLYGNIDNTFSEVSGVFYACKFIRKNNITNVKVYTDSRTVENMVKRGNTLKGNCFLMANYIRQTVLDLNFPVQYVPRDCGELKVTDSISRLGLVKSSVYQTTSELGNIRRRVNV